MAGILAIHKVLLLICIASTCFGLEMNKGCKERERQALLTFKHGLEWFYKGLSTWVGDDCCKWKGVVCNNKTGHVVHLSIRGIYFLVPLVGEINPSLLELEHLQYLDLGKNNFVGQSIPKFFGSFKKLTHLDLSSSCFSGMVPHELGNVSSLRYLDLSVSYLCPAYIRGTSHSHLTVDNLHWLARLTSLQYLDLGYINLSGVTDWLQSVNMLPSLSVLRLPNCRIREFVPLDNINFTSLTTLDLSANSITSKLPEWLAVLRNLVHLDLSSNNLVGTIPNALGRLCNLQTLDFSGNSMDGKVNELIEGLSRCTGNGRYSPSPIMKLGLDYNNFSGIVPKSVGQFSNLVYLGISYNSLQGILSEVHFVNLTRLETLLLSQNSFVLNLSVNWIPPFQLKYIGLGSCQLGSGFPRWLQFQKDYVQLDLYNARILDEIPIWFWNLSSKISFLDLSFNQIRGALPGSLSFPGAHTDLSSNQFNGQLPYSVSGANVLDLSRNSFTGPIISNCYNTMFLYLSNNHLNGSITSSICRAKEMIVLDISNNHFVGEIPSCVGNMSRLQILDLSYNNVSGVIPNMSGSIVLQWLQMRHNNLSGDLPSSLRSVNTLVVVDLSENKLSGSIPTWVGESLPGLKILTLRSNMFVGNIPLQLSQAPLQILDLAYNHLSGGIPSSFGNLSAMTSLHNVSDIIDEFYRFAFPTVVNITYGKRYERNIDVVMKGQKLKYTTTISLVNTMDLSNNNLSGDIPEGITSLHGLQNLNLSGNNLGGKIPEEIGRMQQLQSLDLSMNHLFGEIPSSISALTFLSRLNLSYNNLSGRIPSGHQLQTLIDPTIYVGNHDLCGKPVTETCSDERVHRTPKTLDRGDEEDGRRDVWFYFSITLGFVIGFWSLCGVLLLNRRWRIAYYRFFDYLFDRLSWHFIYILVKIIKK